MFHERAVQQMLKTTYHHQVLLVLNQACQGDNKPVLHPCFRNRLVSDKLTLS